MIVIRREQMDSFRAAARRTFEDRMVRHLAQFSPPLFKTIKEEQMLRVVRLGMEQAAGYGFDQRGPVRLYLELMLLFGSYFDSDPQYPWAAETLKERTNDPQLLRSERLYERAMDYQRKVTGPANAHALSALRNIRVFAARPLAFDPTTVVPVMLRELTLVFPEKAAYIGPEALSALILKGARGARNVGFFSPRATSLVIVLMLAFGHRCGADPLYPWIGNTLRDERLADPEAKAARLEKKALTWLDHVLAASDSRNPS